MKNVLFALGLTIAILLFSCTREQLVSVAQPAVAEVATARDGGSLCDTCYSYWDLGFHAYFHDVTYLYTFPVECVPHRPPAEAGFTQFARCIDTVDCNDVSVLTNWICLGQFDWWAFNCMDSLLCGDYLYDMARKAQAQAALNGYPTGSDCNGGTGRIKLEYTLIARPLCYYYDLTGGPDGCYRCSPNDPAFVYDLYVREVCCVQN